MNVNNKNFLSFINYKYTPLKKIQFINRTISLWLITIPYYFISSNKNFYIIFFICNITISIFVIKIFLSKNFSKKNQNFFVGIHFCYLSVILTVFSYKISTINSKENLFILLILLIMIFISMLFFIFLTYNLLKKNLYENSKSSNKIYIFSTFGAFAGIISSRIFLNNLNNEANINILSTILLIFAFLLSIGSVYLFRYFLLILLEKSELKNQSPT